MKSAVQVLAFAMIATAPGDALAGSTSITAIARSRGTIRFDPETH
jgi:hypothetical protein